MLQKSISTQPIKMLVPIVSILTLVIESMCCESSTFTNIHATVSGRNQNETRIILSNCMEHNEETNNFQNVEATNQIIEKLLKGAFVDLPVESLILSNNSIRQIDKDSFQRLMRLEKLDLSKNKVKTIQNDVFNTLRSLRILLLSENEIEVIENLSFAHLISLTELRLNKNRIKMWSVEWFTNNNRLSTLDLEDNLLEDIPESAFANIPQLSNLVLRGNKLKEIHPRAFQGLSNLRLLDMSENNLTKLHKDIFAPLSGRKLANETDSKTDGIFGIANFQPFFGLWNLYIHRNNITYLADEIINDLDPKRGFKFITLYSNPFQCSCYKKINEWAERNYLRFNVWGKGCKHRNNPVCIVPKKNSDVCVEEVEEDIRSSYYSLYKHYTFYDGTDTNVSCVFV